MPASSNLSKQISCKDKKTLNLGQKCFWVICRFKFLRTIVTFDVNTCHYVIKQYFMQNKQFSNLKPKMSNNYCHIWNQHPQIYQNKKFCVEIKTFKFGPFLSIFKLKFEKANVIFEINTLEFIQIPKIEQNNNNDNSNNISTLEFVKTMKFREKKA